MQKNKLSSFFESCRNRLYGIDAWIQKIVRVGFAEPVAVRLGFGKEAMMMLTFGLGLMTSLMQHSQQATINMMIIFSINIILMFLSKIVAELDNEIADLNLPGYIKDLPKDAADVRLFTGSYYLLFIFLSLSQAHYMGTISYFTFILMQYAAAWTPNKTSTAA